MKPKQSVCGWQIRFLKHESPDQTWITWKDSCNQREILFCWPNIKLHGSVLVLFCTYAVFHPEQKHSHLCQATGCALWSILGLKHELKTLNHHNKLLSIICFCQCFLASVSWKLPRSGWTLCALPLFCDIVSPKGVRGLQEQRHSEWFGWLKTFCRTINTHRKTFPCSKFFQCGLTPKETDLFLWRNLSGFNAKLNLYSFTFITSIQGFYRIHVAVNASWYVSLGYTPNHVYLTFTECREFFVIFFQQTLVFRFFNANKFWDMLG